MARTRVSPTYDLLVNRAGQWVLRLQGEKGVPTAGPFATLEAVRGWIGRNGGGWLNLGRTEECIPNRGIPGQLVLLHRTYMGGSAGYVWYDWRFCEERPRAYAGCGHESPGR